MKSTKYFVAASLTMLGIAASSCSDWLDQEPLSNVTTGTYYNTAAEFEASANYLYGQLYGFATSFGSNEMYQLNFDYGTDLNMKQNTEVSGTDGAPTASTFYSTPYKRLRECNNLLDQAAIYTGTEDISNSVGTAYFFRAWWHFFLLKRYGGVTIATEAPNTTSDIVWGPRNSRYEVFAQILSDLEQAQKLVSATKSSTSNNGSLTIEAVCAFKARVCLFEGTWEKYNGRGSEDVTNGDGSNVGAGTSIPNGYPSVEDLLSMARNESAKFVEGGTYGNEYSLYMACEGDESVDSYYQKKSAYYLFCLEDAASNPYGSSKTDNDESIFRKCYDFGNSVYGNMNLTHTAPAQGSRKLMDMFLCSDGLPIHKSPLFKGYNGWADEYVNRDNRMQVQFRIPGTSYWKCNGDGGKKADYSIVPTLENNALGYYMPNLTVIDAGNAGYAGRKFTKEDDRATNQEAPDYIHIRLPEMLLVNAEATIELEGKISDEQLNKTINVIRKRAYIANLTNALVSSNGLDMKEEIRRERAIELFGEGFRLADLCRWGIAEKELTRPTCGYYMYENGAPTQMCTSKRPDTPTQDIYNPAVWEGKGFITTEAQDQSTYTAGMPQVKAGALIVETANNRIFSRKNYLQAIPTDEIALNNTLLQNPQW